MSSTTELQTWLNGTPTGGPNGDGRYPMTAKDGQVFLVYCPAAQALNPALTEQPVELFAEAAAGSASAASADAADADVARIAAQVAATNATNANTSAQSAKTAAETAKTGAETARTAAQTAQAAAEAAATSATTGLPAKADKTEVWARGMSSTGVRISSGNADLNTIRGFHAFYANSSSANRPAMGNGTVWGLSATIASTEYGVQQWGANGRLAFRTVHNDTWSAWFEHWHSGNFDPATKMNVAGATMLSGYFSLYPFGTSHTGAMNGRLESYVTETAYAMPTYYLYYKDSTNAVQQVSLRVRGEMRTGSAGTNLVWHDGNLTPGNYVDKTSAETVGGLKTFSYGAIRVQGWGSDATSGVVYLGSLDRYMHKPGGVDQIHFKFSDGATAVLANSGGIYTTAHNDRLILDHGIVSGTIPGSANLNSYVTSGFNHQTTNANAASGTNYPTAAAGMLIVYSNSVMTYQTYQRYDNGQRWHRSCYNGTWSAWRAEHLLDGLDSAALRNAANLNAGVIPEARLPSRLYGTPNIIADVNTATENGWYMGSGLTNAPENSTAWFMIKVTRHSPIWIQQEAWIFTNGANTLRWFRHMNYGTWTAWTAMKVAKGDGNPGLGPYNTALTLEGAYGGGLRLVDGSAQVGIYAQNDSSMRFGLGTTAGISEVFRLTMTVEERFVLNGRGWVQDNGGSAGLWYSGDASNVRKFFAGVTDSGEWGVYATDTSWRFVVGADGRLKVKNANSATLTTQPRVYVQSADPGAAAADGDLWIW